MLKILLFALLLAGCFFVVITVISILNDPLTSEQETTKDKKNSTKKLAREDLIKMRLDKISSFHAELSDLQSDYISHSKELVFIEQWKPFYDQLSSAVKFHLFMNNIEYSIYSNFINTFDKLHEIIKSSNDYFCEQELISCNELLSNIDGKSLDDQQRNVVVNGEDNCLVVAGAGSGKTLTIAGKVKYLCEERNIDPKDILLISFTRKSADEMSERISGRLGIPISTFTFHKLGLDILQRTSDLQLDVVDDISGFVKTFFEDNIMTNPVTLKALIEYFAYYLNVPSDMQNFESLGEAFDYEKNMEFETIKSKFNKYEFTKAQETEKIKSKQTLKGEELKSMQEVMIANFLFLNGINYEYEYLYPYKSNDLDYTTYRPDFYLPDYDIYIEHFGIDRNGHNTLFTKIEEEKYLDEIEWKRQFHRENGTCLLETYSYNFSEGNIFQVLESMLTSHDVKFREPDYLEIYNAVYGDETNKYFSEFIKLCCTFINLYKSNGYDPSVLPSLHHKTKLFHNDFFDKRAELFKSIVGPIISGYEAYLKDNNLIDFSDMINAATEKVENGSIHLTYKYIIIDEYQDISVARYKLVKAIKDSTGAQLLCVGDDWQSIYRFSGSDISLFTNFEDYFGYSSVMKIEKTYRNSQQLIDACGKFVTNNPAQIKKHLTSDKSLDYPISFWEYKDNPFAVLKRAIDKLINDYGIQSNIILLGRTKHDFEMVRASGLFVCKDINNFTYISNPDAKISFLTVHKSKGLEADNIILLNFANSKLGFPNKISDDPILELVLSDSDSFLYAEERRLLYVALTRTRNRVFVLTNSNAPSEFMREFAESNSVYIVKSYGHDGKHSVSCPRCKSGKLIIRKNEESNNYFVGCSNYPRCTYKVNDTRIMDDTRICVCGGFMVKRKGPSGYFYGCTNYPRCRHTEQ